MTRCVSEMRRKEIRKRLRGFPEEVAPNMLPRAPTELTREAWGQGAARGVSFISAKTLMATVNVAAKMRGKNQKHRALDSWGT